MKNTYKYLRDRRALLKLAGAGAAGSLIGMPLAAFAQDKPPLKFIVPFPAGTGTDLVGRIYGKVIGERTGRAVVVENKPGANGVIAVQAVLAAPPDGNTIFIGGNSVFTTNAVALKNLPYDPVADFSLLRMIVVAPNFIIVPPNSPFDTIQQLIAEAKRRPKALNFGAGSVTYQMMLEWFNDISKIQATAVPFKGTIDARTAVISGNLDYAITDASEDIANLARAGRVKVLLHTGMTRSALLPNVPSSADVGIPEYQPLGWVAAAVSSKASPAVVDSLRALFAGAADAAEVKNYYNQGRGGTSMPQLSFSGPELQDYQREEIQRWKRIVISTGYKPE